MQKTMMLCGKCAAAMEDTMAITKLRERADQKITCSMCGRKRFGAEYQVGKRGKQS